ncbi:hypothetical protein ACWEWX_09585 [Streptomyces asiaticus]
MTDDLSPNPSADRLAVLTDQDQALSANGCTDGPSAANCIGCELAMVCDSASQDAGFIAVTRVIEVLKGHVTLPGLSS